MALKKRFIPDESGASILLIALMLPLLLTVVGITVDLGRLYAVQSKAQGALDAALLGAVATASSTTVTTEAQHLFRANYPDRYMGSTTSSFGVTQSGNVYNASVSVKVPSSIMQMFGFTTSDLLIKSQVTNGRGSSKLEISLVLDNSLNVDVKAVRNATQQFVTTLFGANATLATTFVSVLPFNVAVNTGLTPITRLLWAQNAALYVLYGGGGGNAYFANRNPDIPPNGGYVDVSDAPPGAALTARFRTPYGLGAGSFNNGDGVSRTLARVLFGSNTRAQLLTTIGNMTEGGSTRTHVGLMWGWFTLSPRWTGRWDASKPTLPLAASSTVSKVLILVSGSKNDVYLGGTQPCPSGSCAVSNDDVTTANMCAAIKAAGIRIYTIGYGGVGQYNGTQLNACSSGAGYSYSAKNQAELVSVYKTIVDSLNYSALRLSQ